MVLAPAHREQAEPHLVGVPEALLVAVLEVQLELEVLQAQAGLPALELPLRGPLEQ